MALDESAPGKILRWILAFQSRLTVTTMWHKRATEKKTIALRWFTLDLSWKRREKCAASVISIKQTQSHSVLFAEFHIFWFSMSIVAHWVFSSTKWKQMKTSRNTAIYQKFERWMAHRASIRPHHGKWAVDFYSPHAERTHPVWSHCRVPSFDHFHSIAERTAHFRKFRVADNSVQSHALHPGLRWHWVQRAPCDWPFLRCKTFPATSFRSHDTWT